MKILALLLFAIGFGMAQEVPIPRDQQTPSWTLRVMTNNMRVDEVWFREAVAERDQAFVSLDDTAFGHAQTVTTTKARLANAKTASEKLCGIVEKSRQQSAELTGFLASGEANGAPEVSAGRIADAKTASDNLLLMIEKRAALTDHQRQSWTQAAQFVGSSEPAPTACKAQ